MKNKKISRRQFFMVAGIIAVPVMRPGSAVSDKNPGEISKKVLAGYPPAEGYILVDIKKCQGCMTCMMACSLGHSGNINLSLSRIQVIQNPFGKYPDDIAVEQCRQCVNPVCVKSCPVQALHIDRKHGNIRKVDKTKCIACMSCIEACPHSPTRAIWNFRHDHAQLCDQCHEAPFWQKSKGTRQQACCHYCPTGAISFSEKIPQQTGKAGYKINLRGKLWKKLGFPID